MSVVIPAGDLAATQLNGAITSVTAEITSATNAGNWPLVAFHTRAKAAAQETLVSHLMGTGKLTAAGILTAGTYGT